MQRGCSQYLLGNHGVRKPYHRYMEFFAFSTLFKADFASPIVLPEVLSTYFHLFLQAMTDQEAGPVIFKP